VGHRKALRAGWECPIADTPLDLAGAGLRLADDVAPGRAWMGVGAHVATSDEDKPGVIIGESVCGARGRFLNDFLSVPLTLLLIWCVHRKGTLSHRALARNAQQLIRSRMKVVLTLERATASFESWLS
jgi:hypothetical protein